MFESLRETLFVSSLSNFDGTAQGRVDHGHSRLKLRASQGFKVARVMRLVTVKDNPLNPTKLELARRDVSPFVLPDRHVVLPDAPLSHGSMGRKSPKRLLLSRRYATYCACAAPLPLGSSSD